MFALLLMLSLGATSYDKEVRPVLAKHCVSCHNGDRGRGGLDLSSFAGIQAGGNSGKVAIAGKPEASLLYTLSAHLEDPIMPPGKPKIPDNDLLVLKTWITDGMPERAGTTPVVVDKPAGGLVPATLLPRATPITALAASPRADLLAISGYKQALIYESGKLRGALAFPEGEVHVLRFSRDGSLLLVGGGIGGQSGKVVAFETRTWKRAFQVGDEADTVLAADLSPDNKRVALGGPGRVVKVLDVADGKQVHAFRKATDFVTAVRFSPDGLLLAAGDRFSGLWVWEARSGREFATLRGHSKGIHGLEWNTAADTLISSSADGTVRLWDMHRLEESLRWQAHDGSVLALAIQPSGKILTAGSDTRIKIWNNNGSLVASYGPAADEIWHVVASADGTKIYSGDWAGEVREWPSKIALALPIVRTPPSLAVVLPPEPKLPLPSAPPENDERALAAEELRKAQEELAETRKALAAAEATAAALRKLVEAREAAAQKAAERLRKSEADR
ncbi:MAG: c-type cytochrome domain-containing protein [Gemmataceae bacterium]